MGQMVLHGSLGPKHQLLEHPLCKYCLGRGIVTPATICDHVEPHHGDVNKFWLGPFQSLCKECHDSTKRFVELHGFRPDIGLDVASGPAPSSLQSRAAIVARCLGIQILPRLKGVGREGPMAWVHGFTAKLETRV
jgi:hypothetical protein